MWPLFSNIYAKQCLVIVVPKLPMPKCLIQDNFALNAQLCAETSHKQPVSVTMAIESVKSTECFLSTFLKVPTSNRNHNGYHSIILVLIWYWRIMISLWELPQHYLWYCSRRSTHCHLLTPSWPSELLYLSWKLTFLAINGHYAGWPRYVPALVMVADVLVPNRHQAATQTTMMVGITLGQRRDDSTDVGSTLGQPSLLYGQQPSSLVHCHLNHEWYRVTCFCVMRKIVTTSD